MLNPTRPSRRLIGPGALAAIICLSSTSALAGEIYGGIGLPGVLVGYAHTLNEHVGARLDYATLGNYTHEEEEEGIRYKGKFNTGRIGLFGDLFPWSGTGFRLTGGLTISQFKLSLRADLSAASTVDIGDQTVAVSPGDYFNVTIKTPSVMPYLGIGWGHRAAADRGWGFHADIGVALGKAKLSVATNLTERGVSQAAIDQELKELRKGVGDIQFLPQLSLGLSYRF